MGKKRHVNRGVEKRCTCKRSNWSTCSHPWTFRYKPRGRNRQQLSLDRLLGYHVDSRTDANTHANRIRTEMDAGTFKKDLLATPVSIDGVTLDHVITPFIERSYKKRNVESWSNAASMLQRLSRFLVNDRRLGDWPIAAITEDVLETFFDSLSTFAAGTRTKYAQLLKRLFLWAKRKGYLTESPISDESTIKGEKGAERRRRIHADLHFHDLRHEGGIRLLEKGWQLHWLQRMYGHASLAQTSKYLHADEFVLPDVMRQFEQKSAKRGAVVVQKRSIERPPLHHVKRTEASKSRPH